MKTGNTGLRQLADHSHEGPQWSPVMKTGNTAPESVDQLGVPGASMEPGHEDREYIEKLWRR